MYACMYVCMYVFKYGYQCFVMFLVSKHIFLYTDSASRRERCCQSPVRGEASRMAKAYAEGLRRRLAVGRSPEGGRDGWREGGDSRGKRVGESIPDGWKPEASPSAGRSHLWKQDASPPAERERIPY